MSLDPQGPPKDTPWKARNSFALLLVFTAALAIRLWHLGDPSALIYDETFYARESCRPFAATDPECREFSERRYLEVDERVAPHLREIFGALPSEFQNTHPPLGKRLIGIGHRVLGLDPTGWRAASAVAGAVTCALLYLLAFLLSRDDVTALLAGSLLAFDFLSFVYSRVAVLDPFLTLFTIAAFVFLALERDRVRRVGEQPQIGSSLRNQRWRIGAAVSCGMALATKWTGVFVLPVVLFLMIRWMRRTRPATAFLRYVGLGLGFLGISAITYVSAYIGWHDGHPLQLSWWDGFWDHQTAMFTFHANLTAPHPFASPPWSWILSKRPLVLHWDESGGGHKDVIALVSPVISIACALSAIWLIRSMARRDNAWHPGGVVVGGISATYLVWVLLAPISSRESTYIYYLVPAMPFLSLMISFAVRDLERRRHWGYKATVGTLLVVLSTFAFFYPVLTARPLSVEQWSRRVWFRSCLAQDLDPITIPLSPPQPGEPDELILNPKDLVPPQGWCWT